MTRISCAAFALTMATALAPVAGRAQVPGLAGTLSNPFNGHGAHFDGAGDGSFASIFATGGTIAGSLSFSNPAAGTSGYIQPDSSGGLVIGTSTSGGAANLTVAGALVAKGLVSGSSVLLGTGNGLIAQDSAGLAGVLYPDTTGGYQLSTLKLGGFPAITAANTDKVVDVCNGLGAACDGATDDTATLQALITTWAGQATILVPAGKTTRTSGLTLPSGTSLRIDGEIELTAASDKSLLSAISANGITISGSGTIDGYKSSFATTPAYPAACINIQSSQNAYVRGMGGYLHIQNCQAWPINAWTPNGANPVANNNINISYVEALNSGHSVECANVNRCYVDHLNVHGIGDYGFSFYGGVNDGEIEDSEAWNNAAGGISLLDDTGESTADQNITVSHNHMFGNTGSGLSISNSNGTEPQHQHVIVDGNVSYGNNAGNAGNYGGYFVYGCSHCSIVNDISHGNNPGGTAATAGFYSSGNTYTTFANDTSYDEGGGLGYGFAGSASDVHDVFENDRVFDDQSTLTTAYGFIGGLTAGSMAQGNTVGSVIGTAYNWTIAAGAVDCHMTEGAGVTSCSMQQINATPVSANSVSATLGAVNCGQTLASAGSGAITYTVPTGLPAGCRFSAVQAGSGTITFAAGSGMTALGTLVTSTAAPRLDMQVLNPATTFVVK